MSPELESLIQVFKSNRENMKLSYNSTLTFKEQGYEFSMKIPGKRYRGQVALEVQKFCFDRWKEGHTLAEIGDMLGLKSHASVKNHLKNFTGIGKSKVS
ncbi:hypothetical protein CEY12_06080 [Chryseobacterium sp. T16E-39]|nr:hypothetical protein CEY12_06080 [Chryseobacterium sp. T16E-39]